MMEGETGTPVVERLPDEETSFIGRKVEAPRRMQRQQQLQARRKRLAILTTATVTMLAFGAVGVFLTVPSDTSDEVQTTVSQAMASATTMKSGQLFIPNFAVYDEDGDGKVSLGEYLDRLAINYDTAREKVKTSSLDEEEKARLLDSLGEDFKKHSECVTSIAQVHEDEMMTEENFNEIYEKITKEFCPMNDGIPDSYQATETAPGKEEEVRVEVNQDVANPNLWGSTSGSSPSENSQSSPSDSESSEHSQGSTSDSGSSEHSQGSPRDSGSSEHSQRSQSMSDESSDEPEWNPEKPTLPPRPVSAHKPKPDGVSGKNVKLWKPSYPTAPPIPDTRSSGWNPDEPTDSPSAASLDVAPAIKSSSTSTSEDVDTTTLGIGDGQWNPTFPISPPEPTKTEKEEPEEKATYRQDGQSEHKPEAWNVKSPFGESNREYEKPTSAYNAYTGASTDTGAYNAYTGVESNTYGKKYDSQSYPEAATQESPYGESNREYEKPTSAYNAYTGTNTDTGAYNAYTGVESNTYGKKYDSQSYQERGAGDWKTEEKADLRGSSGSGHKGASEGATYNVENLGKQLLRSNP